MRGDDKDLFYLEQVLEAVRENQTRDADHGTHMIRKAWDVYVLYEDAEFNGARDGYWALGSRHRQ